MIKKYFSLTKPGIIAGNALAAFAGFSLAAHGEVISWLLPAVLLGIAMVIGGSCVLNNVLDRDIDARMRRTMGRGLVDRTISVQGALAFALILISLGLLVLWYSANLLTAALACFGVFAYVCVYSMWAKRTTAYATEIGSISGGLPPVIGYVAVTGSIDVAAVLLFVILCGWQMPHFFAIALRRMDEYAAACIPVLPLTKGIRATKMRMSVYMVLFGAALISLYGYGYVGMLYLAIMIPAWCVWLVVFVRGLNNPDTVAWARKVFLFSLVFLPLLALSITIGGV